MKFSLFVSAVVASLVLVVALAAKGRKVKVRPTPSKPENYCDAVLCPKGIKHVACNNTGTFAPSCPANSTQLVDLSKLIRTITSLHNELRNELASGKIRDFPRAARMATMTWSNDLAKLAAFNARVCDAKHDDCHNTHKFLNSGQNIAILNTTRTDDPAVWSKLYPEMITKSIRAWWNESSNATVQAMREFPNDKRGDLMRHFAVMAWENNTQVGCAAITYAINQTSTFKMTCNYAANYLPGAPVYNYFTKRCQSGYNKNKNKNLCTPKEVF